MIGMSGQMQTLETSGILLFLAIQRFTITVILRMHARLELSKS